MVLSEDKLRDLVGRIVEASHPLRVVLFGSFARGEAGPYSDIDVLVVVEQGSHRRHTAQQIYRNLLGFGESVDIVVATPSDLEQYAESPGLIYREAVRDGRELYAA